MFVTTLITTFLNILATGWVADVCNFILLWIDKGVYQLVQASFTIFIIMCQLNLNVIYNMAAPLVDRLKALVIVFIIFKVGIALISYMLNPDKAAQGSKKLLINILICAAMLVSCNFVFSLFNELSMMIIGKPDNYTYTTLAQIANAESGADEGLIMRFFFGTNSATTTKLNNVDSIGNNIAFNSLCATFPDMNSSGGLQCRNLIATIADGTGSGYNLKKLSNVSSKLDVSIDGHPGIALILGLYMVYSVVKASIEIGVRMFKLMLLQLVAPIAIISVASDEGTKAKPFSSFIKMYLQVFVSAFTRISAILLVTVFVSKVFGQIDSIIGTATSNNYGMWVLIICIVAGYRFAGEIPKMIDKIFTTSLGESQDKGGFGKFLSSLIAAPVLGAAGMIGGIAGAESIGAGIYGAGAGLIGGLAAGLQGNTIAEKFKNAEKNRENVGKTQLGMAEAGGVLPYVGGHMPFVKGHQDRVVRNLDKQQKQFDELTKTREAFDKRVKDEMKGKSGVHADMTTAGLNFTGFDASAAKEEFGTDADAYASKMLKHNDAYNEAQQAVEHFRKNPTSGAISINGHNYSDLADAQNKSNTAEMSSNSAAKGIWEKAYDHTIDNTGDSRTKDLSAEYTAGAKRAGMTATSLGSTADMKAAKKEELNTKADLEAQRKKLTSKGTYKANHPSK